MKVYELIAALAEFPAGADVFVTSPGERQSFDTTYAVAIDDSDTSSGVYIRTRKEQS